MRGRIEKRAGNDGKVSYRIKWEKGTGPRGERRQGSQTFRTRKEAEAALAKAVQEAQSGTALEPTRKTLAEFLTEWEGTLSETIRPTTERRYRDLIRTHITPHLGGVRLAKLTALDVQRFYAERLRAGLSPGTVQLIHDVLHKALKQAYRWGLILRNPAEFASPPRPQEKEVITWSAEQVVAFLDAADGDDYRALWYLAVLTGLRRGELLGLKWEDLDLERGALSVQRSWSRAARDGWDVGSPKTKSSRRLLALSTTVVELLKAHRVRQLEYRLRVGATYSDRGFVFTQFEGRPLHVNTIIPRFHKLTDRAGLPRIRFHDLRHTSATLSLAAGTHPKVVQERLGHSSITMTMDRYSHTTMHMQQEEAQRLEETLKQRRQQQQQAEDAQDS